ncbi:MAG: type II secretion system GspH family protein [Planctomycetes bacterium]|nr:type II secretion system GspH family protein [Planctomycetota bacterium]
MTGRNGKRGYTLIEIMVVLGIIAIILGVSVTIVSVFGRVHGLLAIAQTMRADFTQARNLAAEHHSESRMRFIFDNDPTVKQYYYVLEFVDPTDDTNIIEVSRRYLTGGCNLTDRTGGAFGGTNPDFTIRFHQRGTCDFDESDIDTSTWGDGDDSNELGELYFTDGSGNVLAVNINRSSGTFQYLFMEQIY